jgi:hypothetical protein
MMDTQAELFLPSISIIQAIRDGINFFFSGRLHKKKLATYICLPIDTESSKIELEDPCKSKLNQLFNVNRRPAIILLSTYVSSRWTSVNVK